MIWNKIDIEPRFYEIDGYNIVNNMYYVSWCEMARLKLASDAGALVPKLYDDKIMFVVDSINVSYLNAVSYWDRIQIESVVRFIGGSQLDFCHSIKSKITNQVMAKGSSRVVCLKEGRLLTRLPDWLHKKLTHYIEEEQKGSEKWPT